MKGTIGFLLTIIIWLAGCDQPRHSPLEGVWILVSANREYLIDRFSLSSGDSLAPTGFRFYASDSVEVYADPFVFKRFTTFKESKDTLIICRSEKNTDWKPKIIQHNDSLKIFSLRDTLVYVRALKNITPARSPMPERMVLSIGYSWSSFFSIVLYPDGRSIFMTSANYKFFYIKNSKGLIRRP